MAQNAIAAAGNPGVWTKSLDPNENLTSFNRYIRMFRRWTSVAGVDNFTPKQMWDLLIITGGPEMEDLIQFQSGIETRQQAGVQAQVGPPAIPAVPQIVPTTWDDGMALARAAIERHTNQTEARHFLWTEMPASNYTDWRKWGQELVEQAKRCDWDDYDWQKAALDALIYQCPDKQWRQKILMEKWDFNTALDYGIRFVYAKAQSENLSGAKKAASREEVPIDRVKDDKKEEVIMWDCWRCLKKHPRGFRTVQRWTRLARHVARKAT